MATGIVQEILPPVLDPTSKPPPLFDGTTRLVRSMSLGLQDKIKLVPLDLQNRPAWYKEKVNPTNKVPSLEHNNEFRGESLDLLKYIDSHFEGPALFPNDPAKIKLAEELLAYTDTFNGAVITSLKGDSEKEHGAPFDYLEAALSKFHDGPFFLGQFSLVDIAYAPFIERYQPLALDVKKYDVTAGRPKLASWIKEINKIEAYKQTKRDPQELVAIFKKRFDLKRARDPSPCSGFYFRSTFSFRWNNEGLQDKIKLVPIDLQNRPAWYKEKVYPTNKVPSLEHNNEVRGESLDLLKYIDSHFEGPTLFPEDPEKIKFAEELLAYTDTFSGAVITSLKGDSEKELGVPFDYLEAALSKFNDGPFFLGQFSLVDIAYAPFIERYQPLALDVKKYDITPGRPKLASWIEEINKIEAYKQTKRDPQELISVLKKRFFVIPLHCTFEINLNSLKIEDLV
ncbi:hypothetical protein HHK36_018279 [Tetracentron sinense]|uniref:GST N-terminal domain-containing protein n=1 Tax=Tetracentron sinense TaxID=13715 RepID=A0A834YZA8_TETSI|nr:hypothetical protein HHK36_018279 [Tetracentron sinense]